jgi:hypothetical protein
MKKTTKKNPSKAVQKKAVKDLDVRSGKSGTVRGGDMASPKRGITTIRKDWIDL